MHAQTLLTTALLTLTTLTTSTPLQPRASNPTYRLFATYPNSQSDLLTPAVSYINSTLALGRAKYSSAAEAFLFLPPTQSPGGISFLSYHQTPTGYQSLYIYPARTAAVGFSVPHGSAPQDGVALYDFAFDSQGRLTVKGEQKWLACATAEQAAKGESVIFWKGAEKIPDGLTCKSGVTLTKVDGCSEVFY